MDGHGPSAGAQHPQRGSFAGAVIAGAHDGDPARLVSAEPVLGLRRESTYLFATLRDSTGALYAVMRRLTDPPGWPKRLWTRSSSSATGLQTLRPAVLSAATASVTATGAGATARFVAPASNAAEPMECTVAVKEFTWDEGSILQLAGADVSQGLQWYLPDADGSMLYASRLFAVEGYVFDAPVRGIAGVDEVFLDPGRCNYVDDPITKHHRSTAWCTWATCFADGTAESGHVAFGPGRFGFAIRSTSDGDVEVGHLVEGEVTFVEGLPTRAIFDVDGEQWEFEVDRYGRSEPVGGPVLQAEGLFRRRGETRQHTIWSASLEVPA